MEVLMWLQMKIDGKRVDGEQRRKNMEEEAKQAKYKAEYQVMMKKWFTSNSR